MLTLLLAWALFSRDVDALAAPDFAVRQAAEARLSRWAWLTWRLCDRPFADLEQRRRARRIVEHALPRHHPPIAVLAGQPLPEWVSADGERVQMGGRPGESWRLAWLCPDRRNPLFVLVRRYGERTRSQSAWVDWQLDIDGREATRLLVRDLLRAGVPTPAVQGLLGWMRWREEGLAGWKPVQRY